MSNPEVMSDEDKAAAERRGPASRPQQGPPHMRVGMPTEKSADFGATAKRLLRRMRPERKVMSVALFLTVVSVTLSAVGPRIIGRATDYIFAGFVGAKLPAGETAAQAANQLRAAGNSDLADMVAKMPHLVPGQGMDYSAIGNVLLLALALYAAGSLLAWIANRIMVGAVNRVIFHLREEIEEKLHRLPLPYLDTQPRGELLSRATNDIDNVAQSLQQTMSQLLTAVITVIAMVSMMMWISPLLSLIALVTIPSAMVLTGQIGKRSQGYFMRQWASTGEVNAVVEESFSGHSLVKVFGHQDEADATFAEANDKLYRASRSAQFASGVIMPMMMFMGNINYVLVAVVGGWRVATGAMTLGAVQSFIIYSRQFTQPLTQVASMANLLQSGVASAERVFAVLDAEEESPEPAQDGADQVSRGCVEFDDVTFSYVPDRPLIEHLNLTVEPGEMVAIVGPTGAGKTTLVNLIMRFYELNGGRILLDGTDIATMSRQALRSRIGMVLQDTWLFAGTIADNIAYGKPGATIDEVHRAAEATYVDRFVHSLPQGYDTVLDDEASNISAGEKQLLTIARAFISDPELLILDEATSSVDTRTERLVQEATQALRSDRTSFVIAHRLSTIRDANLIIVMENGQIAEQGTHDELLAAKGAYYRLYQAQFVGAAVDLDGAATVS